MILGADPFIVKSIKKPRITRNSLILLVSAFLFTPFLWVMWTKLLAETMAWSIPNVLVSDILSMPVYWACTGLIILVGILGIITYKSE